MLEAAVQRSVVAAGESAQAPVWPLTDDSLQKTLDAVRSAERSLAATRLHLIREIDARAIPARVGARTPMWVAERMRITPVAGRRMLRLA
ncbi:MAG TPA: HNH endonuclease, partial [Actinoplanes sp.]